VYLNFEAENIIVNYIMSYYRQLKPHAILEY